MGTHPNAILQLVLTPDDLSRKTYRAIMEDFGINADDDVCIGGKSYNHRLMEDDYYESSQISAKEGDIVFWDLVTYGYGEKIKWSNLESQKNMLEEWAKSVCEKYKCSFEIFVSANYW